MKKPSKKKNSTPDRIITHTFDNDFKITLGPSALKKLDEANKSLKKMKKIP